MSVKSKICGALLGVIVSMYSFNSYAQETIHVGTEPTFAPFGFVDDKTSEIVGFDIDVINAIGKAADLIVVHLEESPTAKKLRTYKEGRPFAATDAKDGAAITDQITVGMLHALQHLAHMPVVGELGPRIMVKLNQVFHFMGHARVNEQELSLWPGAFLPGFRNHENGIQHRINPQRRIPANQAIHAVYDMVAHCMGGVFLQKITGNTRVAFRPVGHIVGKAPQGVLKPAFAWPGRTEVGMVLGKPVLIKDRAGITSAG